MQQRVITIVLLIGLAFGLLSLGSGMTSWRLPDREQGYAPAQPIDYSHRLHAGELGIDCRFCHWASYHSRYAGIPSTDICMKCHDIVTMSWDAFQAQQPDNQASEDDGNSKDEGAGAKSPATTSQANVTGENRLLPLYNSLGLDAAAQPVAGATPYPIPWVRVHNLPDYVYFNHSAHMAVGITCQRCHGPVESMVRVRQFESLSMGWCVDCHRESTRDGVAGRIVNAPTNCATCHY